VHLRIALKKHWSTSADYLGIGALFPTSTKANTEHVTLEQLREIKAAVSIPIVGIGGINAQNAASVKATGVDGIALSSGILSCDNIVEAAMLYSTAE
jgi:thiamine-phosphate pyrophosphorylase